MVVSSLSPPLKGIGDGCTKLQPVNCFSLLPILDPDIPHGGVKTFMAGEIFYGEGIHSFLMQPGAESVSQKMGASLTFIDAG